MTNPILHKRGTRRTQVGTLIPGPTSRGRESSNPNVADLKVSGFFGATLAIAMTYYGSTRLCSALCGSDGPEGACPTPSDPHCQPGQGLPLCAGFLIYRKRLALTPDLLLMRHRGWCQAHEKRSLRYYCYYLY